MKRTAIVLAAFCIAAVPAKAGDFKELVGSIAQAAIVGATGGQYGREVPSYGYGRQQGYGYAERGYAGQAYDDGRRDYRSMAGSLATRYGRTDVIRCGRNPECAELVEDIVATYPRREGVRKLDRLFGGF